MEARSASSQRHHERGAPRSSSLPLKKAAVASCGPSGKTNEYCLPSALRSEPIRWRKNDADCP